MHDRAALAEAVLVHDDLVLRQAVDLVEVVVRVELRLAPVVVDAAVEACSCPSASRTAICTEPGPAPAPGTAPVTVTSSTASMRGVTIEKKPSVDCSMLPVLTPSIVMLTVLFGRPLMTAPRGPPPDPYWTPGSS